jgi:hypothetical protein
MGCEKMGLRQLHITNRTSRLIVFTGESNSGGIALNSDATAAELAVRPMLQIWDNAGTGFDSLDVGSNNLIGHDGLSETAYQTTSHSWELQLANIVSDAGYVQYLVKTGQGGSVLADWGTGGSYYTTLVSRVDAAIAETNINKVVFWYTHGINNRIAGTTTGAFKTAVQTHIANLKADYPGAKFIMLKNMTDNGNDVYNTVIQEIDDADADVVSIACSTSVQGDGNHWTYAGQKANANTFYNTMLNNGW